MSFAGEMHAAAGVPPPVACTIALVVANLKERKGEATAWKNKAVHIHKRPCNWPVTNRKKPDRTSRQTQAGIGHSTPAHTSRFAQHTVQG